MIYYKTLDDDATAQDGLYILIDRHWPVDLNDNALENPPEKHNLKNKLTKDHWYPDAAPSMALCQWIGQTQSDSPSDQQQQEKEFRQRYRQELIAHPEYWMALLDQARYANLTLVYACEADIASNPLLNPAKMLAEFLDDELDRLNDASSPVCYAHLSKLD